MAATGRPTKGISLSRGPALIVGVVLLVVGLYLLYRVHNYPKFSQFPSGDAHIGAKVPFHIFGVNGWSAELTAAAGGLLLLGAAQHSLAKLVSFLVMVALGGVAIWALVHHHSALGLFAATTWTIVLWGGAAAALFLNLPLPRLTPNTQVDSSPGMRPTAPPPTQVSPAVAAPAAAPVMATTAPAATVPTPVPVPTAVAPPAPATTAEPLPAAAAEPVTERLEEPETATFEEPETAAFAAPGTTASEEPVTEVDALESTTAFSHPEAEEDEPVTTQMTTEADPPTVERTVTSTAASRTTLPPAGHNASSRTSQA